MPVTTPSGRRSEAFLKSQVAVVGDEHVTTNIPLALRTTPMRTRVIKAVAMLSLAAPIVGPAAVSHLTTAVAATATDACPAAMSDHQGGSYTQDSKHLTPIRIKGSNVCYNGVT